jgi:hypothetical protein
MSALLLGIIAVWLFACLVFATDVPGKTALLMPIVMPVILLLIAIHIAATWQMESTYHLLPWLRERYCSLGNW